METYVGILRKKESSGAMAQMLESCEEGIKLDNGHRCCSLALVGIKWGDGTDVGVLR